jgi:CubicO group peptidase (beta-lactamase class C family)
MRAKTNIYGFFALVLLTISSCSGYPTDQPEQVPTQTSLPTQGWQTNTPEEQGFDSSILAEELQSLQESNIPIDSLLIIRNGDVLLDAYFTPYDGSFPHNLASVTKSIMTTLIGIAIDQGKIELDQSMISYFPNRVIANLDERKESITVRHLVSNQNGFESGCLSGDELTLIAMRSTPDWVQAALDRKVTHEPGTGFCYDSPGMHLLSAILQEATGMTALEFAQKNLFEPLGIHDVLWRADPQGYTRGWGDLYMKPPDAAKIGYLWLNKGVWEGRQIISASWVEDSVKANSFGGMGDYGYGWWISSDGYYATGRGGQNIRVYPAYNAVIVTTGSGFDYDQINPLLEAAFVNPSKSLPANPTGVAKLDNLLSALAQQKEALPIGVTPDIPDEIFGKTYVFDKNPISLATLRLDAIDSNQATVYMNLEGSDVIWPIGLDGTYRMASSGQALRGYWSDSHTLVCEFFEDGLNTLQLHFMDDRVEVGLPEQGIRLEGQKEDQ